MGGGRIGTEAVVGSPIADDEIAFFFRFCAVCGGIALVDLLNPVI